MSVFNPIKDIDKRSKDRTQNNVSKKSARIEMLKRSVKGFASALIVSAGITTLGTMAAADASLTASTMGLNKVAGMAIGSALAIGMTFKQIRSWSKQQKKDLFAMLNQIKKQLEAEIASDGEKIGKEREK